MNCPHCGERIPDGSEFCIACGNEIGNPEVTQQTTKTVGVTSPTENESYDTDAVPVPDSDSVFAQFMSDEAPKWDGETMVAEHSGDTANLFVPLEDTYAENLVEPMVYLPGRTSDAPTNKQKKSNTGKGLGIVIAAIVGCAAAVAVVAFVVLPLFSGSETAEATSKAETPAAEQPVTSPSVEDAIVKVNLDVPDLGKEGSRVPIHVEGELRDGTAYAQDLFLMPGETNFKLPVGLYEVSVSTSPISAEGYMYTYAEKTLLLAIGDDGTVTYEPNDFVFTFELKDAADITYEDIDNAAEWIRKDPERVDRADELESKARLKVDEANKAKEAERQSTSQTSTNNNDDTSYDSTSSTDYNSSDYSYTDDDNDSSGSQGQQSSSDDSSSTSGDDSSSSSGGNSSAEQPGPIDDGGSSDSGSQTGEGGTSTE